MWVIGVYAAMMLFVIVQSVRRGLPALYFAREPAWELGAPSDLPEAEDRRVTAFVEQLRAAGFVLERESKLVAPALRDRPAPPTLWTAIYSHPDATSYALLSISRSDLPGGNAVWSSTLVFASRLAGQRRLSTSTSPTRFAMPTPPGWDARRVVDATATALWALHQARLQAAGGAERVDDPWSDYLERERQAQLYAMNRGALIPIDEHHVRIEPSVFVGNMLLNLNPVTGEERSPWKSTLVLMSLVGVGAAFAHRWAAAPVGGALSLGAIFTVLVVATFVAFPKTAGLTVISVELAGAEAWMSHHDTYLALAAAVIVGPTLGGFIVRRFAQSGHHTEDKWLSALRVATLALGCLAGLALFVFLRMPRELAMSPRIHLALLLFVALTGLFAPVSLLLNLFAAVRGSRVFRVANAAALAVIPFAIAFGIAETANIDDRQANATSGHAIVAAVRAHHARVGAMPSSLTALAPTDLPVVPRVAGGWPGAEFDYAVVSPTHFSLSYRSPSGRVGWHPRASSFIPSPLVPPTPVVPLPAPSAAPRASASAPVDDDED